jgi:hypothetical protein
VEWGVVLWRRAMACYGVACCGVELCCVVLCAVVTSSNGMQCDELASRGDLYCSEVICGDVELWIALACCGVTSSKNTARHFHHTRRRELTCDVVT